MYCGPFEENDYWLGLDYDTDHDPREDKLSLVLMDASYLLDTTQDQVGFIIDTETFFSFSRSSFRWIHQFGW